MHTTPGIHATQSIQDDVYAQWVKDPEGFWAEAGDAIHWNKRWDRVLDSSRAPFYRWFPGGVVNTCYNALDWHVEHGRGDQPALVYDSPVTGTIKTFTFRELLSEVPLRRSAGRTGRREGPPDHHLHAHGPGSGYRDAGVRANRGDPFGRIRGLRLARARGAHQSRGAHADRLRLVRHRSESRGSVPAVARQC